MPKATQFCVGLDNKPGELERIAAKLGKARININYVYGRNAEGDSSTLVLSVADLQRAAELLRG